MSDWDNRQNDYDWEPRRNNGRVDPIEKDKLSFSDSWKQNSVELAAIGAVVVGAANLAMHGNAAGLASGAKSALKHVGRGFDRYLSRSLSPVGKMMKNVGFKAFRSLQRLPGVQKQLDTNLLDRYVAEAQAQVNLERVKEIANKRYFDDKALAETDFLRDNPGKTSADFTFDRDMFYYDEKARTEEVERIMRERQDREFPGTRTFLPNNYGKGGPGQIGSDPKSRGNFFGAALAGLGFGTGLTAFHGVDRAIRDLDRDHPSRDKNFEIAGSFIKAKGDSSMNKSASFTRAFYDGLSDLVKRSPQAVAAGLGYTGVSLATAAALKNHHLDLTRSGKIAVPEGEKPEAQTGPRVIIELGNDNLAAPVSHTDNMGGYSLSPRVASEEAQGLAKLAGIGDFLKNVGGRHGELNELGARIDGHVGNYRMDAAEALKKQPLEPIIRKRFGNLAAVGREQDFAKDLLDAEAQSLKQLDIQQSEKIKDEIARDRLVAGGGLLGLGGAGFGLAALGHHNKEDAQ